MSSPAFTRDSPPAAGAVGAESWRLTRYGSCSPGGANASAHPHHPLQKPSNHAISSPARKLSFTVLDRIAKNRSIDVTRRTKALRGE